MPCSTAATLGAAAAIRAAIWSLPFGSNLSLHGWPNGLAVAQLSRMFVKPMSLPEICTDTRVVSVDSALNCGGLVPASVLCDWVMSSVVAPLQETSARL